MSWDRSVALAARVAILTTVKKIVFSFNETFESFTPRATMRFSRHLFDKSYGDCVNRVFSIRCNPLRRTSSNPNAARDGARSAASSFCEPCLLRNAELGEVV